MSPHVCRALGALALWVCGFAPAAQAASFGDTEFDLAHYTISTFPAAGDVTTFSQTLDGGNPGAALQDITTRTPATNGSRASNYIVNNRFEYDPGTAGAVESIDLSIQTFWQGSAPLTNNGAIFVIAQDGDFFIHSVTLPAQQGTWLTAQAGGLAASDFALVTDLRSRATDATSNPDFAGSAMQFGFMGGLTVLGNLPSITRTAKADNFSVTLTPVPEPSTWALMAGGLLAIGALSRRSRTAGAK
jgi:hypothetical protein